MQRIIIFRAKHAMKLLDRTRNSISRVVAHGKNHYPTFDSKISEALRDISDLQIQLLRIQAIREVENQRVIANKYKIHD